MFLELQGMSRSLCWLGEHLGKKESGEVMMYESFRNEGAGRERTCRLLGRLGLTLSDMGRY